MENVSDEDRAKYVTTEAARCASLLDDALGRLPDGHKLAAAHADDLDYLIVVATERFRDESADTWHSYWDGSPVLGIKGDPAVMGRAFVDAVFPDEAAFVSNTIRGHRSLQKAVEALMDAIPVGWRVVASEPPELPLPALDGSDEAQPPPEVVTDPAEQVMAPPRSRVAKRFSHFGSFAVAAASAFVLQFRLRRWMTGRRAAVELGGLTSWGHAD